MQMHVHKGSGAWRPRNRSYRLPPPVSKLFDAAGRVAVPGLAAGELPKILASLEAAGGAPEGHQRLDGMIEGALYLGVELFMFEPLGGQPAGGTDQPAFPLPMLHLTFSRLSP